MHLWLLLAGAFTLQESYTTIYVVLQAFKAGYSFALINLLWLAVTTLEILVGFYGGKFLKKRVAGGNFERFIEKHIRAFTAQFGTWSEKIVIALAAIIILPFAGGFVGAWLDISLLYTLAFSYIGDLFWLAGIWLRVYGASELGSNTTLAFVFVVLVSIVGGLGFGFLRKRFMRTGA